MFVSPGGGDPSLPQPAWLSSLTQGLQGVLWGAAAPLSLSLQPCPGQPLDAP